MLSSVTLSTVQSIYIAELKIIFSKLAIQQYVSRKTCYQGTYMNSHVVFLPTLTVILIWQFGDCVKIAKLTYAIIDSFILRAWVFIYTVMKSTNLKSRQQRFLSKSSNIMAAYISAYTVIIVIN